MAQNYIPNIRLEGARIVKKNFSGERYGDGQRNFGVIIPDEMVEPLQKDGWNIKYFMARPDDPTQHQQAWLQVKVKFGNYPPSIVLVTSKGKILLDEYTVAQLDRTRIASISVDIRPYSYPAVKGRPAGVSAWLNALVAIMDEERRPLDNPFLSQYDDVPTLQYAQLMKEFEERR